MLSKATAAGNEEAVFIDPAGQNPGRASRTRLRCAYRRCVDELVTVHGLFCSGTAPGRCAVREESCAGAYRPVEPRQQYGSSSRAHRGRSRSASAFIESHRRKRWNAHARTEAGWRRRKRSLTTPSGRSLTQLQPPILSFPELAELVAPGSAPRLPAGYRSLNSEWRSLWQYAVSTRLGPEQSYSVGKIPGCTSTTRCVRGVNLSCWTIVVRTAREKATGEPRFALNLLAVLHWSMGRD